MRAGTPFITVAFLLAAPGAAAHGGPEHLGHHWASAEYGSEIRLQLVVIAAAVAVCAGGAILRRITAARKERGSR